MAPATAEPTVTSKARPGRPAVPTLTRPMTTHVGAAFMTPVAAEPTVTNKSETRQACRAKFTRLAPS